MADDFTFGYEVTEQESMNLEKAFLEGRKLGFSVEQISFTIWLIVNRDYIRVPIDSIIRVGKKVFEDA